jgi:hypothetical protein
MTAARRSKDRKHVLCGECRAPLCRRDRLVRFGKAGHYLVWDDGLFLAEGGYVEMTESAQMRIAEGHKPGRHDWTDAERLRLSRALRTMVPAKCRLCGAINELDRKNLDVQGVAPRAC